MKRNTLEQRCCSSVPPARCSRRRRGLDVPKDISVVGIDDLEISRRVKPALTMAHLSTAKLRIEDAQYLLACLRGGERPKRITLPLELIVWDSSASLK